MARIETLVGPVPTWLALGEITTIDGIEVRPVLGDWSHRIECDRPPDYVTSNAGTVPYQAGFDTSEAREPVRNSYPGKPISDFAGIHTGRCAILFNGGSLQDHDLWKLYDAGIVLVGMNRTHVGWPTYRGPQPDYLCVIDQDWFIRPELRKGVVAHPKVINGSLYPESIGWRAVRHPRMYPFSFDLDRDGFVGPIPCTTGHLAMQFAAYLGFTELYCVGLDMGGKHFDDSRGSLFFNQAIAHQIRMAEAMYERGLKAYVAGSPDSKCKAWPKVPFEAIFNGS